VLYVFRQLLSFMKVYRKFWLTPIIVGTLILSGLVVFTQTTAISPFIYAIF
jgi:Family of unknown function (DUF5989)